MINRIEQLVKECPLEEVICVAEILIERMKSAKKTSMDITEEYLAIEELEKKLVELKKTSSLERAIIYNAKASLMTSRKIGAKIGFDSQTMSEIDKLISTIDGYKYGDEEALDKIFTAHNELADKCLHEFEERVKNKL